MDNLDYYRQIIRDVLTQQTVVPISYGQIAIETIFDADKDRYLVVFAGWNRDSRVYGPLAHIDIIDGKLWVQRDGTAEGLPILLMEKGVPKEHIVVAYRHPSDQKLMGFAMA